jgi:hypothetical protein
MDIADKRIRIEAPPFPLLKAVYSTAIVRVSHLALMLWQGVWLGLPNLAMHFWQTSMSGAAHDGEWCGP